MAKYLVIVESPAKVSTIRKFLGSSYEVMASNGHVRDLPKSSMGIDVENDYEPHYITIRGKGELLSGLRKAAKKADKIYLATDPDREGEAISWHLMYALKLDEKKVYRITFNEITKNAVKESLKHARSIDMDRVDAQQARRCLDRMVGYRISPLLWAKVKGGLSAGRVQSAALRIICDKEAQIEAFVPQEYWSLEADVKLPGERKAVTASYYGDETGKVELKREEQIKAIEEELASEKYFIKSVKKSEHTRKAPLPFTTSTLQQEAGRVLNFSTQKTMRLAQQLYEGVSLKGEGTVALITYLRTDSTRISQEALEAANAYVAGTYGAEYVGKIREDHSRKQNVQDAHEAIRPTEAARTPLQVKDLLPRDLFRLYQLIWRRFMASVMKESRYETTTVKVGAGRHVFALSASRTIFDGFLAVYDPKEDKENSVHLTREVQEGSEAALEALRGERYFTQPPAHFTEASLVKTLEELGIGRPSTYAPTITLLLNRRYVTKENKNLYVTELGDVVNRLMVENFPAIVDVNFTAAMESLLDGVEEGEVEWKSVIRNFYPDLDQAVQEAEKKLEKVEVKDEVSDVPCELCGRMMVYKYGPHGKFLACPGFPECRNTRPYYEKIGVKCPKCGGDVIVRKTRKGRRYYGCVNNPECDYMVWQRPKEGEAPSVAQSSKE
ncbi:MAG: type I DNA topoisomerase [Lachnospiraceae bacterium]|nr:type I DNA topoisomerase [Lachnospiraceae bacterium]